MNSFCEGVPFVHRAYSYFYEFENIMKPCSQCRGKYHCPICPNTKRPANYLSKMQHHIQGHWNTRLSARPGTEILACHRDDCGAGTYKRGDRLHYHCPYCEKVGYKIGMRRHYETGTCLSSSSSGNGESTGNNPDHDYIVSPFLPEEVYIQIAEGAVAVEGIPEMPGNIDAGYVTFDHTPQVATVACFAESGPEYHPSEAFSPPVDCKPTISKATTSAVTATVSSAPQSKGKVQKSAKAQKIGPRVRFRASSAAVDSARLEVLQLEKAAHERNARKVALQCEVMEREAQLHMARLRQAELISDVLLLKKEKLSLEIAKLRE